MNSQSQTQSIHAAGVNQLRLFTINVSLLTLLYLPTLIDLVSDWYNDANYSHGFLAPLISGYLVWKKRESLSKILQSQSGAGESRAAGVWLILIAMGMYILGNGAAEFFTTRVSYVLALAGLTTYHFGAQILRKTWFEHVFLLFMIPLPYVIYYAVTFPMQLLATKISIAGLDMIGVSAIRQGNVIHLSGISLEVAEACSGIRSMISLLALGAVYGYMTQKTSLGRWIVFLSTAPLALITNVMRVFTTAILAYAFEANVTDEPLHTIMGLSVFVTAFILLFIISAVLKKILPGERG